MAKVIWSTTSSCARGPEIGWKRQSRSPASSLIVTCAPCPSPAATGALEPAGRRIESPDGLRLSREHDALVGIVRHAGVGFDLDRILLAQAVAAERRAHHVVVPPEMLGEPDRR